MTLNRDAFREFRLRFTIIVTFIAIFVTLFVNHKNPSCERVFEDREIACHDGKIIKILAAGLH